MDKKSFIFLGLFVLTMTSSAWAQAPEDMGGLKISAAGDLVGRFGLNEESSVEDYFGPRTAELMFYAPVDHIWTANMNLAAHRSDEETLVELHELYIGSSRLIPRSRFRLGKFFLGVGRLNRFHQHEWPFVTAPKVHREFFAHEAVIDEGAEFSALLPLPFYLDLTLGVTSGHVHGHEHTHVEEGHEHEEEEAEPVTPIYYSRLATFFDFGNASGMEAGLNVLKRTTGEREEISLYGLDLTGKWRRDGYLNYLFQSEIWYKKSAFETSDDEERLGFYIYNQYALHPQWSLGLRLDGFSVLSLKEQGESVKNMTWAAVPVVAYKASEFSTVRLAYNEIHRDDRIMEEDEARTERILELQMIFILGQHPSHDF